MAKKGSMLSHPPVTQKSMADRDYQAEDDHRTMTRAAEISSDPSRMSGVKKHHRKATKQLNMVGRSITGSRGMPGGKR